MSVVKKKPRSTPETPWPSVPDELHKDGTWTWLPLLQKWRDCDGKPEERVRQRFVRHLCEECGYCLEQMKQEQRLTAGTRSARADIVIWESPEKISQNLAPVLVIECKSESVEIDIRDYYQGESYARSASTEFFVATNLRYTAVFKLVPGAPGDFVQVNEIPKAIDWGDAERLDKIRNGLRTFNKREFQDLLFRCHSILRDVHKMEPGRAFDTISKILFVKMYVERSGLHGTFTVEFIDLRSSTRLPTDPPVHEGLFEQTRAYYKADDLFSETDRLEISEQTFRRVVKELERFDLSKTGDDIKGLAFERFLGNTFRGQLGQYFTPRPVVNFMVGMLDPREGELIADPAAGSGGFLIRAFEYVREAIAKDLQARKQTARASIEAKGLDQGAEEESVDREFAKLNRELLPSDEDGQPIDTRVGRLAWNCIFGCDAEVRAARTAKMNMIMHGDGHGGIHYHDGLVDINGIFPGRFDIVLTNPPFGSNVGEDQRVGGSEETRVPIDSAYAKRCEERYGKPWRHSHEAMLASMSTKILDLFEIGKGKKNRATEIIFVERCLRLLKRGGRMGIVLPDGNLNNPSLSWLRRWCEGKARILAVVSLPEETFSSAKATVKASLVFLRRFTESDETAWEAAWAEAHSTHDANFNSQRQGVCSSAGRQIVTGGCATAESVLDELASLGIKRMPPTWSAGPEPEYPRGIGRTKLSNAHWKGKASDGKRAAKLKRDYRAALQGDAELRSRAAQQEVAKSLREIDEAHNRALWGTVREEFDYPVFVARPKFVGINSSGETGNEVPNDLTEVLAAYRAFQAWVESGAKRNDAPNFPLPSAAGSASGGRLNHGSPLKVSSGRQIVPPVRPSSSLRKASFRKKLRSRPTEQHRSGTS